MTVYEKVTERIVTFIEQNNVLPWHKPWATTVQSELSHRNFVSGHIYRGMNMLLTGLSGYEAPYWLTVNQANKLGAKIRKGEHGTPVIFWSTFQTTPSDDDSDERSLSRGFYKAYTVFNVTQCDDIEYEMPKAAQGRVFDPIGKAEATVLSMPDAPPIIHSGIKACYSSMYDKVTMPCTSFDTPEDYYSTLFHELAHSTGHDKRLGRFKAENVDHQFASRSYSKEELVAEMASCFVLNELGIGTEHTESNSIAYLQNWVKALKSDARMIVQASGKAVKAAEYIMNRYEREEKAA